MLLNPDLARLADAGAGGGNVTKAASRRKSRRGPRVRLSERIASEDEPADPIGAEPFFARSLRAVAARNRTRDARASLSGGPINAARAEVPRQKEDFLFSHSCF